MASHLPSLSAELIRFSKCNLFDTLLFGLPLNLSGTNVSDHICVVNSVISALNFAGIPHRKIAFHDERFSSSAYAMFKNRDALSAAFILQEYLEIIRKDFIGDHKLSAVLTP